MINYKISMRKTKAWIGQNNIKKKEITIYLPRLIDYIQNYLNNKPFLWETVMDEDDLYYNFTLDEIILIFLIERICIETRLFKVKVKNRNCKSANCACYITAMKILSGKK